VPRIILAPNTFRGSLTAEDAAEAMARGVLRACPNAVITRVPMADGGDGSLAVLIRALDAEIRHTEVRGPGGEPVDAAWALAGTTAIIEMAEASGLRLLGNPEPDLLQRNTFGTGQLILAALEAGARTLYLGVGGSATIDGGCGALAALGLRFRDASGATLSPIPAALGDTTTIDRQNLDPRLAETDLVVLADVTTPPDAAIARFGPQKGLRPADIAPLEHLFACLDRLTDHRFSGLRFGGAAGGIAAGLALFAGARLAPGAAVVADLVGLSAKLKRADLILTGEGRFDATSREGKVPGTILNLAQEAGVPAVVLAGSVSGDPSVPVFSIGRGPTDLARALTTAADDCAHTAEMVTRLWLQRCVAPMV